MRKKYLAILTALALLSGILPMDVSMAAKKVTLSNKKLSVTVGKTKTLKLKNNKKSVKWTVTSGKKNVTLKSKKKTSVKIVGKKKGTAKVQAKIGKKKYVCMVTVKAKTSTKKATTAPTNTPASNAGKTTAAPTPGNTVAPTATVSPTSTPSEADSREPGLYDENMQLLYSWDELVEKGWIRVSEEKVTDSDSQNLVGNLVISPSVTIIAYRAFADCSSLTSIEIPSSVTGIEGGAFSCCSRLTSIEIPSSVTSIGNSAFYYCKRLSSVRIPSSVTSIEGFTFYACDSLTSIEIPSSVTSIDSYAFWYCDGIESIIVDSENTVYDSRNDCNAIIESGTNTLIYGCKSTVIPTGVTSIGEWAFYACYRLESIEIPSSVTWIGEGAFGY
ncbi:MAG: leucine-rich repeat protein, partial [Eubacterium sp.]|nr:leucine-rich repeat protein [Eubacterium sp.]